MTEITLNLAKRVLEVVDAGLVRGMGRPKPGQMCVEAAVCYAMDLPHGDNPTCVDPVLRSLKIALNDKEWSSNRTRAAGLRRLAIAQLGSDGKLDQKKFIELLVITTVKTCVYSALMSAASIHPSNEHRKKLIAVAKPCLIVKNKDTARAAADAAAYAAARAAADAADAAARAAANAADAAAAAYAVYAAAANAADVAAYAAAANAAAYAVKDKELAKFAEEVVQILIKLKVPGTKFLHLAPLNS